MSKTSLFYFFEITQDLNKIKKPEHSLVSRRREEFQQKIFNSVVVGVCRSCQFFRQKTWFLKNNSVLSKFLYGVLHYLISSIKL